MNYVPTESRQRLEELSRHYVREMQSTFYRMVERIAVIEFDYVSAVTQQQLTDGFKQELRVNRFVEEVERLRKETGDLLRSDVPQPFQYHSRTDDELLERIVTQYDNGFKAKARRRKK